MKKKAGMKKTMSPKVSLGKPKMTKRKSGGAKKMMKKGY